MESFKETQWYVCVCERGQIECKYRETEDKVSQVMFFHTTLNTSGSLNAVLLPYADLHKNAFLKNKSITKGSTDSKLTF